LSGKAARIREKLPARKTKASLFESRKCAESGAFFMPVIIPRDKNSTVENKYTILLKIV